MSSASRSLALLVGLALAVNARAEMIGFTYSWDVLPSPIITGPTGPTGSSGQVTFQVGASQVAPGSGSAELGGPSAFLLGIEVRTVSSATTPADSFDTSFHLKLNITDSDGHTGSVKFDGTIAGSVSVSSAALSITYDSPVTDVVTIAGRDYSVTISPALVQLPAPGTGKALIDATIQVSGTSTNNPDPPINETPEPATLLLAGLAAAGAAGRHLWKRRAAPQG